jgi:hypothetical protein
MELGVTRHKTPGSARRCEGIYAQSKTPPWTTPLKFGNEGGGD